MWRLAREEPNVILRGQPAYNFNCYCLVQLRWLKIRVPVFYFWLGDLAGGRPEVEYGEMPKRSEEVVLREV
jgi:hypothetical protein